ncbi:C40 family peptidase [Streptomyces catenulae]|uniref:C40 family peptidase n=1 Tax=Streptomyces catenulae TaxID=66875 RepID=A0ABV2YVD4_9ACTN|nr:C40 family peptidase [Streptomyces catenulae]
MSGPAPRSSRTLRAAGATLLLGATALAGPAASASAAPTPDPATTAAPDTPAPDTSAPGGDSPAALLRRLQALYRSAEESTEAYNATQEDLKATQARATALDAQLQQARARLAGARADAGRLARQQYQGGGPATLAQYVRVLLADDPEQAMDRSHLLHTAASEAAATVDRMARDARRADTLARQADAALARQRTLTAQRARQQTTVQNRLKDVEKLLAGLSEDQLATLDRLESDGAATAQRALVSRGALGAAGAPSSAGDRAIAYGLRQVGKPYVWGATGPDSFDCSGLTSQAWSHAGRPIPRTSQEQWKRLPHVPLNRLRPGDLVVYFPGATHVALYLGAGKVVQAPRPGTAVRVSPLAANPPIGAVRPDPGARPVSGYTAPRQVTADGPASGGADTGYATSAAPGH